MDEIQQEQVRREQHQRDAALGRRIQAASSGSLGPIISRWINVSVAPVAGRLRLVAEAYLAGDMAKVASLIDSPIFGLAEVSSSERGLDGMGAIFQWCLKGNSPGREDFENTYADDMVLAGLGSIISGVSTFALRNKNHHHGEDGPNAITLSRALSEAGEAIRETGMGQFLTQVQGAGAMLRVRRTDRSAWSQLDSLNAIAAMMNGQVRATLEAEERGELNLEKVGSRTILKVITNGTERRVSLRKPDANDWDFLEVCRRGKHEADKNKLTWVNFALILLCCAQAEHGWFDLMVTKRSNYGAPSKRWKARYLLLSEDAVKYIKRDLDKWLHMGFTNEPMLVKPEEGDYLTVKHRAVTGRMGPMGLRTDAKDSTNWEVAAEVMAGTGWQVAKETLEAIKEPGSPLFALAAKSFDGDEDITRRVLGEYSRDAHREQIFLPIYMDFRGRVYPKTNWVTYQGTDLQKGLLRFPRNGSGEISDCPEAGEALAMHLAALHTMDKAPKSEREAWLQAICQWDGVAQYKDSDEPIQLAQALHTWDTQHWDQIPCQIDGTCNGLQHLSALFRDEAAAPWVNLDGCTYEDPKADIYGEVSKRVTEWLSSTGEGILEGKAETTWWVHRVKAITIDRSLCKKPVMVLPYGGTLNAIEESITGSILDQTPDAMAWKREPGYEAFMNRDLRDHPLFRADMKKLACLIHDKIKVVIPRAMAAMDAFREIAGKVGERSLEWSTGFGPNPMWIVHAYPKSARRGQALKGLHFPNSVRGLQLKCGRDEIDPRAHRSGIVANFIHSQDAAHLVHTMSAFREKGGTSFGAIHDCLIGRPSEMHLLNAAVREAFYERYVQDPLSHPVRLRSLKSGLVENFDSWYSLAKNIGVEFPDKGTWKPSNVLDSAWFFS